ncbi:TonB-dependent siderophore receptor [Steroidobacter cummioxidans]|uniref:TonB-dependent siderophore receptor n=1 Tax=Steroidobacter cummioxidans TaxID=1803913 RepID=UPI0012905ACB|nr:TonB-dependent siderophore receptor [Steroidobacter cummioxidans]
MIWKKTLLAAAMATACMQARAAEPTETPEARPTPPPPGRDKPQQMATVRVEADSEEESLKAERQSSSSKLELTLRETPQSVSVITQESLRARQVIDFGQALEMSAGVNQFTGTGPFGGIPGFGFNSITIRGIEVDSVHDVREDGFINTTYFAIPDMAIYERIDVIKGPSSVAYGRGSAGGVVNRIRKKPLAEARGEVAVSFGSFDTYRADLDLTGPLNEAGSVRGRVIAAYSDEGSFVDGVETNRTLLAPSIDFDLTDTTRLLLEGLYQREDFIPNTGFPLAPVGDGYYEAPNVRRSLYFGVPTRKDNQWDIYSGKVQLEQAIGDQWFATLRLNANKTKSPIQADRYAYGFDNGSTALVRNDFVIDRDIWAGELQITGDLELGGMPVKIAGGIEYSDNDYHRRGAYAYLGFANIYTGEFAALPDAPLTPGFEYTTRNKASSAYLQAQVRPIERLAVLLGLRYDDADAEYNALTTATVSRKKDDAVTGRIGLTYDVTDNVAVYGMYGKSFLPTIFDVDANGQILDPETGKIYEAGIKTEWLDRRLAINAAVYRIDRDNVGISVEGAPGTFFSIPSGLQRSEGFELEINGEPLPGWKLSVAYNQLDSSFTDPRDPFFGATPGGAADWQVGLFTSYELQSGPLQGFGVGATVFAIDDRGLSTFSRGMLDGYERVDLNLFYKGLPDWEFALLIRNVLDERYVEGADRPGAIAQFGTPTAALLTVRRSFGFR